MENWLQSVWWEEMFMCNSVIVMWIESKLLKWMNFRDVETKEIRLRKVFVEKKKK